MATAAMLELQSVAVARSVFDAVETFRIHLARPGANPLWRFSDGAEGSAERDAWDALVLQLCELEAESVADGLDDAVAGPYLDGATTTVSFHFFDGRKAMLRVEPAAPPDARRDAVIAAIDAFAERVRARH